MTRPAFATARVTGASLSKDRYAFIEVPLAETAFLIAVWKLFSCLQPGDRTICGSRSRCKGPVAMLRILRRQLGRSIRRISVASAAGRLHVDNITRAKLNVLV